MKIRHFIEWVFFVIAFIFVLAGAASGATHLDQCGDASFANNGAGRMGGAFAGLPQGATWTHDGQIFQISYSAGDGNDILITVIPEPAAAVLAATVDLAAIAATPCLCLLWPQRPSLMDFKC